MSDHIQLVIKKSPVIGLDFNPEPELTADLARSLTGKPGVGLPPDGQVGDLLKKQSDQPFDVKWSNPPRLVTTAPLLIQNDKINLPSAPLGSLFMDLAWVFLDVTADDILPNGMLVQRGYVIEEHINVMVDGMSAVFVGENGNLDGKYAKVSYLAWPTQK